MTIDTSPEALVSLLIAHGANKKSLRVEPQLMGRAAATISQLVAERNSLTMTWEDRDDGWSEQIAQNHPLSTGDYATHDLAMRMINNRHSKGSIVALTCFLLTRANKLEAALQPFSEYPKFITISDNQEIKDDNNCSVPYGFIRKACEALEDKL